MRTRRFRELAAAVLAALAVLSAAGPAGAESDAQLAERWRSAFEPRAALDPGGRAIVVLAAPSLADRVAERGSLPSPAAQRQIVRRIAAFQERLVAALERQGVRIRRERSYTRTLNAFSAVLDARAVAALERMPGVAGVYPVRTVVPASVAETLARADFDAAGGRRPKLALAGGDGRGITVAILDTGIAAAHPALDGRVARGFDLVDGDRTTAPAPSPDDPSLVEAHGTQMAGLVAGSGGGVEGVAPEARILPIRVLGWGRAADGSAQPAGRTDVLLAGLERAVDPDGDGDVRDGAEIALAALVEPFAAFSDAPEARAVAGAARLGTLVVAAAGNDGPGAEGTGTVGAPGSAAAALTVGAVDTRAATPFASVVLEAGGEAVYAGPARLLGPVGPEAPLTAEGAGVAVLAADGSPLEPRVREVVAAGAQAVVVFGAGLPAGSLDLDPVAAVPVVAVPLEAGNATTSARRRGWWVRVEVTPTELVPNAHAGRVAPFSSRGPAFDGTMKPDVVAPGVGLVTALPGGAVGTVTGTSAAAAVAAGAAALVAQARPRLDAAGLAGVLTGTARPLGAAAPGEPIAAQGAGLVDPAAAARADLAFEPATLALGRITAPGRSLERSVSVRNLTGRPLSVSLAVEAGADGPKIEVNPRRLRLAPGASADVLVTASAGGATDPSVASGALVATAAGAGSARLPWLVSVDPTPARLLRVEGLSRASFRPSVREPSLLTVRVGRAERTDDGTVVEPVSSLEAVLWTRAGRRLGVLARARDLLPGTIVLGLTGRGPDGRLLAPGRYVVRLEARSGDAGEGRPGTVSRASAAFRILPR